MQLYSTSFTLGCAVSTNEYDTRACITDVKSKMASFDILFDVALGYKISRHSGILSTSLQQNTAAEGQDQQN